MNPGRFLLIVSLFLALLCPRSDAQLENKKLVVPSLLADTATMAPGQPFTAGVLLKMEPGWHTYWRFAGDSGGAPRIEWQLPEGFTAGPIQWPIPHARMDEGDLLTYVYEDEVLLLVQITPPADFAANEIPLKAQVRWLVCEKTCIPGQGEVALTLTKGPQAQPANTDVFARWRGMLPKREAPAFQSRWEWSRDNVILRVTGLPREGKVEFFPVPPQGVSIGHPQVSEPGPDGARAITIPLSEPGTGGAEWEGVLAISKPDGSREGWEVSSGAASATPVGATSGSTGAAAEGAPLSMPSGPARGLANTLLLAFLGGLILNVMPCVLPVIALKIFGFVKQAGEEPRRVFHLGLAFVAGVFVFFMGLAVAVIALKAAGTSLNWGFQFQNPYILAGLIALVFVFGLNLLGVFELTLSSDTSSRLSQLSGREGLGGAFLHGLFTTLLGTSCTAPFLGVSLGAALTQSAPVILLIFATVAAGMSLPYLLLTARPAWMRFLPKPGAWMERFKQLMGFVMLAVVVWLLGVLGSSRGAESVSGLSWFLLALGIACWIYGLGTRRALAWTLVSVLVIGGYAFFLAPALKASTRDRSAMTPQAHGIPWVAYSEEKLQGAIQAGQPVFVDFTAEWCLNCKAYEKLVLETDTIRGALRDKNVLPLRADWTNDDPEITQALRRFGRVGVPLYVLYRPGENNPVVMDAITVQALLGQLNQIESSSGFRLQGTFNLRVETSPGN